MENTTVSKPKTTSIKVNDTLQNTTKHPITTAFSSPSPYQIAASLVLSRPPILTRDITEFEKAFYFYQRRLDRRLALPFTRAFYFKEGTIGAMEWKNKQKNLRKYNPYGEGGWADELKLGQHSMDDEDMDFDDFIRNTVTGEDASAIGGSTELEAKRGLGKPLPRETKADIENDARNLNRMGSRTLYLLAKRKGREEYTWKFPQSDIQGSENLREGAERALAEACGVDMNTWIVGNVPIGYYDYKFPSTHKNAKEGALIGRKVFFMKGRIMAGKPKLANNKQDLEDYKWLTKQEIQTSVSKDYWTAIRHFLVER